MNTKKTNKKFPKKHIVKGLSAKEILSSMGISQKEVDDLKKFLKKHNLL